MAARTVTAVLTGHLLHDDALDGLESKVLDGIADSIELVVKLHTQVEAVYLTYRYRQFLCKSEIETVSLLQCQTAMRYLVYNILSCIEQLYISCGVCLSLGIGYHASLYLMPGLTYDGCGRCEGGEETVITYHLDIVDDDKALVLILIHKGHVYALPGILVQRE